MVYTTITIINKQFICIKKAQLEGWAFTFFKEKIIFSF